MMRRGILVLILAGAFGAPALADQIEPPDIPTEATRQIGRVIVCTATNADRTQRCTASCRAPQVPDCEEGDAGAAPTCRCAAP